MTLDFPRIDLIFSKQFHYFNPPVFWSLLNELVRNKILSSC